MFEGLGHLFAAFETFANFTTVFNVCWATLVGITIGALPGLTATMGVALLTTLTYKMAPEQAILVLISCYVGAIYGGSRSAILLNIPGTPANAATTMDGFPLAKAGRAGEAMGLATTSSMIGTFIGIFFLAIIAPALAEIALDFQSYEYFWLAIFGIVIAGQMCSFDDALKGWIAGFLGLFVAMIGQEGIHAEERFVFGWSELSGGIALIPALVGTFGVAEILTVMRNRAAELATSVVDHVVPRLSDLWHYKRTIVRSGIIGTAVGIIPGVGEDIGAWISYAAARRASKERDQFGKGSKEGLCAAETGNNAAIPGAIIPALTLAVPGSAPAAVLLAAMLIHGLRPGPMIMIESPDFVFQVVWMVAMATLAMGIFGILLTRPLLKILKVPRERLMPVVFVLCVIGPYAITLRLFDIYVTLFFGVLGFILREMKYPMAPLVLGVILGDILDKSLRRALVLADGDLTPFFFRPISAVLWITTALVILSAIPGVQRAAARVFGWNKA
ncbi:tripartite tricarboxylate transporter permease [Rhodoplanes sp. TEM]|uniref:Tripartite tricarboxylate transporter permease n=1 Tax=Rhodoplanes tepidamans TaxID=200616 RepID=A0ABT5JFI0_RHOTP|nr:MULTISPECIES: tripartite tricarboxylate transporter permease [Rhodoplanes]MDC7788372.1 tripartite tricarboxylate transporter permease [Rhodoplanes tepidamans]MDC7985347.1 tripartite tricarboxylate transporter permease [Rhodoplanes sp. TEM]MDQ0357129.1 putative tricarboxylic transport membrane protein [Rhodoplanes tepidamans]